MASPLDRRVLAAYQTLTREAVPRATIINIVQRVDGSIGTALFAVVLQCQISLRLSQTRGGGLAAEESVPPGLLSDPANEGHVWAGANGGRLAYALWKKDGAKPGRRKRHRRRRIAGPVRAQRPRRNMGKEKGTEQTHLRHVVGWIDR